MHRGVRFATIVVVISFLVSAPSSALWVPPAGTAHVVYGASPADVIGRGIVIDAYDAFVTAALTSAQSASMHADGFPAIPLDHRTGRGAHFEDLVDGANVSNDLRASATDPWVIVQFRGPVKASWLTMLADHALVVSDYLPHYAYLVKTDAAGRDALRLQTTVRAIEPYHPAFKLGPDLPTNGTAGILVMAHRGVTAAALASALEGVGATVLAAETNPLEAFAIVDINATRIHDVAKLADVAWIENAPGPISFSNDASSAVTQSGSVGNWSVHDRGLDGRTQIIGTCDQGLPTTTTDGLDADPHRTLRVDHEAFHDDSGGELRFNAHSFEGSIISLPPHRKIALYYSTPMGDGDANHHHGPHTAGTLAGDAPPYGVRNGKDGVAFASRLAVCDIAGFDNLVALPHPAGAHEPARVSGANITSSSWSTMKASNAYAYVARAEDEYSHAHPDLLLVRAAGNGGAVFMGVPPRWTVRTPHQYGGESLAKGVLAVGGVSANNDDTIYTFSSWGGASDGRWKPNILARANVVSAGHTGYDVYLSDHGTSMATPAVAGAAALALDYFHRGFYPSGVETPADARIGQSSALLRAMLMASGARVPNDREGEGYPNVVQGWGRVLLDDVLYFAGEARRLYIEDRPATLDTGKAYSTSVTVAQAGEPLKVLLAWTDFPGVPYAPIAIVNDLHLVVEGPGGTYRGNVLVDGESHADAGDQPPDAINVEEGVLLASAPAGTYTIRVVAGNVPLGPQDFALVVTGALQ